MEIDHKTVARVAHLARIDLPEEEVPFYQRELSRILDLFEALAKTPTEGVLPMAHPEEIGQRMREDIVSENDGRDVLMALAPAAEGGLYLVPKVIE